MQDARARDRCAGAFLAADAAPRVEREPLACRQRFEAMEGAAMTLRLRYVAGVSPAKWLRVWADRRPDLPLEAVRVDESLQMTDLSTGGADLAFVRLPVDETGLHSIALWHEHAVAVLAKDHALADATSLELADLADEPRAAEQADARLTIELVATGAGFTIVPHGVARLHHRRDVVAVPLTDAPTTRIALVWRIDRDDADVQEFVGVVRGRRADSSRGGDGEHADAASAGLHRDEPATDSSTAPAKPAAQKPATGAKNARASKPGKMTRGEQLRAHGRGTRGGRGRGSGGKRR